MTPVCTDTDIHVFFLVSLSIPMYDMRNNGDFSNFFFNNTWSNHFFGDLGATVARLFLFSYLAPDEGLPKNMVFPLVA